MYCKIVIFILQLNINSNVYFFIYMLFIIVIIINIPFLFVIPNKQRPDCAAKLQFSSFHLCFKLLCRGWMSVTFLPVSSPSVTSNEAKSRKPNIPVCVVKYTPKPLEDCGLPALRLVTVRKSAALNRTRALSEEDPMSGRIKDMAFVLMLNKVWWVFVLWQVFAGWDSFSHTVWFHLISRFNWRPLLLSSQ